MGLPMNVAFLVSCFRFSMVFLSLPSCFCSTFTQKVVTQCFFSIVASGYHLLSYVYLPSHPTKSTMCNSPDLYELDDRFRTDMLASFRLRPLHYLMYG
jgi:hypothetical protein